MYFGSEFGGARIFLTRRINKLYKEEGNISLSVHEPGIGAEMGKRCIMKKELFPMAFTSTSLPVIGL